MRVKDVFAIIGYSLLLGIVLNFIAYYFWTDTFDPHRGNLLGVIIFFSIIASPLAYVGVRNGTTCENCGSGFVKSKTTQTDIEKFVIYKTETESSNGKTWDVKVPYEVRRYVQHMRCDNCAHHTEYEDKEEKKI